MVNRRREGVALSSANALWVNVGYKLLDDYLDYLRARDLRLWDKDSPEARYIREMSRKTPLTYEDGVVSGTFKLHLYDADAPEPHVDLGRRPGSRRREPTPPRRLGHVVAADRIPHVYGRGGVSEF